MTITQDDIAKHLGVTPIKVSRSFTTPDQVREPLSAQRVPSDAYGYHGTVVHDQWVGGNEWNWSSPVTFEAGKRYSLAFETHAVAGHGGPTFKDNEFLDEQVLFQPNAP